MGNGIFLFSQYTDAFSNLLQSQIISAFLMFLSFSLLFFGLHFPTYFRNYPRLLVLTNFVLGMGIMLILVDIGLLPDNSPYLNKNLKTIYFNLYYAISFFAFVWIIVAKQRFEFPAIREFIRSIYIVSVLTILLFGFLCLFPQILPFTNQFSIHFLLFIDLLFFSCFSTFLIHYSFTRDYLTHPFSFLLERSKKVFEDKNPASHFGSRALKEKLWNLYDERNWQTIMDSFWFQILVDETLDNALEHGGKRGDDLITVHVYESKKFIDVYVIDSGKGFNPRMVPSPLDSDRKLVTSGRGIHILKKLFLVRWNFLGNEVSIRVDKNKNREWKTG